MRMESETGALLREMVAMYTQDIIALERKNIKLENKINRMRSGSKRFYRDIKKEKDSLRKDAKNLKEKNDSLKLGIMHRDEIINYIFENTEDKNIKDYLQKTGILDGL